MNYRRRKLGQHFLKDPRIYDRMIKYGKISKNDVVLEVGAGRGELTERLAEKAGEVIAIELDEALAEEAERRLRNHSNVKLLVGDALKLKPSGFNKVVSNPPYSISTKLMEWLIESNPELMVLTLQKEFTSKLVAEPGSPKYLYISFLSNLAYKTRILEIVPRSLFIPPPKIDSTIILMEREASIKLDEFEKKILKNLFTRRKQKLNRVLRDMLKKTPHLEGALSRISGETLSRRIFQLSPTELLEVANALKQAISSPG